MISSQFAGIINKCMLPRAAAHNVVFSVFGDYGRDRTPVRYLGKDKFCNPRRFLNAFADELSKEGISTHVSAYGQALPERCRAQILVYNETWDKPCLDREGVLASRKLNSNHGASAVLPKWFSWPAPSSPPPKQWNSFATAHMLQSHRTCHAIYTACGLLCPKLLQTGDRCGGGIIVLKDRGAGQNVASCLEPRPGPLQVAQEDCAFQFIDSAFTFEATTYYSSVRILSVGAEPLAAIVRVRNSSEGVSVHLKDMRTASRKDKAAVDFVYTTFVKPHSQYIRHFCQAFSKHVGLGFFSHDFVPCAHTNKLYACESGIKFSTAAFALGLRVYPFPPEHPLPLNDHVELARRAARLFYNQTPALK
jgi:hypothetical protein